MVAMRGDISQQEWSAAIHGHEHICGALLKLQEGARYRASSSLGFSLRVEHKCTVEVILVENEL
jgi:hypothetical protein